MPPGSDGFTPFWRPWARRSEVGRRKSLIWPLRGCVDQNCGTFFPSVAKASSGPPIRLFGYSPSRSTHAARTLYEGMRPGDALMSDGYEPYAAIAQQHRLVHLGCWAHCRRYFHEALQALPKDRRGPEQLSAQFIELIGRLYKVEADARRDDLDAQALQQRRTQLSKAVLEQIEALALQHLHGVLPGSLLGKALHYLTAQWPKLVR